MSIKCIDKRSTAAESTKTGISHFCAAFKYSMAGLRCSIRETAVRHELILGLAHVISLCIFDIGWMLSLALTSVWVLVVVVELLNTAVETVVDLCSPQYHELAGRAKDLGSAAVFLMLLLFLGSWIVVIYHSI